MRIKILFFLFLLLREISLNSSFENSEYFPLLDNNISFSMNLDNEDSNFYSTKEFDHLIDSFMHRYKITGASVAISNKERLIYAKGFGIADKETGEYVQPGHIFRIASISKLITAVGILKLFENGKLALGSKVFGQEGILNDDKFLNYKDPKFEKITISNLLNHTAGLSTSQDIPIFNSLSITKEMNLNNPVYIDDLIEYSLNRKLRSIPGKRYSYSNLGYAILGKVIERISGMPYEDYITMEILKPLGIKDMHLGKNFYQEKFSNEVMYFEPPGTPKCLSFDGSGEMVPLPYGGNNIELLGAAGGWVASSSELLRFITAIDGFDHQNDILSKNTIEMMTNSNSAGNGLFGWMGADNSGTWWRTGTFTGTTALVVRQENGINWIILMNTSNNKRKGLHSLLYHTMNKATARNNEWPDIDLFFEKNHNAFWPNDLIAASNKKIN